MVFKEDFEQACRRIEAWWNNDALDRAAFHVTSRKEGAPSQPFPPPADLRQQWLDADYIVSRFEHNAARTFYGAEAIPKHHVDLGPGAMAAFLAGRYVLAPNTVWFPQAVDSLAEILQFRLEDDNEYWRAARTITEMSVERGKGKFLTSVTDIGGVTDVLASLRRNQNLLLDLVETPEQVKQANAHLLEIWFEVHRVLHAMTQRGQTGGASWLCPWSPGTHYPFQCDFSAMIGPKMFEEFVLPELQAQARYLDHSIYHLDGPDAVKHLDLLLEMPELDAIQWVPGDGAPREVEWEELLKKIQRKGKAIWVHSEPEDLERFLSFLRPEGLHLQSSCPSEAQARDLIRLVERCSSKRTSA